MGSVVVHDLAHFEFGWDIALDLAQEAQKLASPMTWIATPDDLAGRRVQSREQGQGSMARIVVGTPLDLARAHGKPRLRPIQRLDLALLVDAQNERAFGRRQVQADNIVHLLDK